MRKKMNKQQAKINKTKSKLFKKISKIDDPLAKCLRNKREFKTSISEIKGELRDVSIDTIDIKKIVREYCENIRPINSTTYMK